MNIFPIKIVGITGIAVAVISIIGTAISIRLSINKNKHQKSNYSSSCLFISFNTLRQSGTDNAKEQTSDTV